LGTPTGNQGTCSDAGAFFIAVFRVGYTPFFYVRPSTPVTSFLF